MQAAAANEAMVNRALFGTSAQKKQVRGSKSVNRGPAAP